MTKIEKLKELINLGRTITPFEFYYESVYITQIDVDFNFAGLKSYSFKLSNDSKIVITLND